MTPHDAVAAIIDAECSARYTGAAGILAARDGLLILAEVIVMVPSVDGSLCPNCHKRPADTALEYDELVASDYHVTLDFDTPPRAFRSRRRVFSYKATSARGKVTLCRECAAAYARSLSLRKTGHWFTNIGMALIVVGFVTYFAAVILNTDLHLSPAQLIPLTPAAIGLVSLVVGLGMELSGRVVKRGAIRFLNTR